MNKEELKKRLNENKYFENYKEHIKYRKECVLFYYKEVNLNTKLKDGRSIKDFVDINKATENKKDVVIMFNRMKRYGNNLKLSKDETI